MDKKSIYLLWAFFLIVIGTAYMGYRTMFVERDFVVHSTTECDPTVEPCFKWCDEEGCEEDYYKKIVKKGYNIPICNEATQECEPLACEEGEPDCEILSCTDATVDEGEICTNPRDFIFTEEVTNIPETIIEESEVESGS